MLKCFLCDQGPWLHHSKQTHFTFSFILPPSISRELYTVIISFIMCFIAAQINLLQLKKKVYGCISSYLGIIINSVLFDTFTKDLESFAF